MTAAAAALPVYSDQSNETAVQVQRCWFGAATDLYLSLVYDRPSSLSVVTHDLPFFS